MLGMLKVYSLSDLGITPGGFGEPYEMPVIKTRLVCLQDWCPTIPKKDKSRFKLWETALHCWVWDNCWYNDIVIYMILKFQTDFEDFPFFSCKQIINGSQRQNQLTNNYKKQTKKTLHSHQCFIKFQHLLYKNQVTKTIFVLWNKNMQMTRAANRITFSGYFSSVLQSHVLWTCTSTPTPLRLLTCFCPQSTQTTRADHTQVSSLTCSLQLQSLVYFFKH